MNTDTKENYEKTADYVDPRGSIRTRSTRPSARICVIRGLPVFPSGCSGRPHALIIPAAVFVLPGCQPGGGPGSGFARRMISTCPAIFEPRRAFQLDCFPVNHSTQHLRHAYPPVRFGIALLYRSRNAVQSAFEWLNAGGYHPIHRKWPAFRATYVTRI
jgi:hypothetical protein